MLLLDVCGVFVHSNGVGMSGVMSQPSSRRVQLRANSKMELMKQQVEQEKIRRRAKPFTTNMPFTRQSESTQLAECPVKVCILYHACDFLVLCLCIMHIVSLRVLKCYFLMLTDCTRKFL